MKPFNSVASVSSAGRLLAVPLLFALLTASGCTTAFTPEICSSSAPGLSPKLVETDDFQKHADSIGRTPPDIVISCACYDKPRNPACSAAPIKVDVGGEQKWDCPAGWVATCRMDKTIAGGLTIFGANAFEAYGATLLDNFQPGPFGGELGPNGEGVPPGPNQPLRIILGPTFEYKPN